MSNCVVGSGGSRLPCSTIAEHRVEGCDHFSHDGDDDDLGFFVGVGEAIVEGLEGGTVTACTEGGHVKDVTDRHPTTIDAAVSLELAAVEVIWCEADEGGDLLAAHLPEFWQQGDEREGQHGADAWHRGQQLIALSESHIGGNHLGQALVEEADIGLQSRLATFAEPPEHGIFEMSRLVLGRNMLVTQLSPHRHDLGEPFDRSVPLHNSCRHNRDILCDQPRIEAVVLGQHAAGAGELTKLVRVDTSHRQPRCEQGTDDPMPPAYVRPYVKRQKNDAADAEAICEAVTRANMRFVATMTLEQQSCLMLHRTRHLFIRQQTAVINAIRAHLAEFGIVAPVGRNGVEQLLDVVAHTSDRRLPEIARACVLALGAQLRTLKVQILNFDRQIMAWHRSNEASKRLDEIPGVGPALATALVASVADPKAFRSGRNFSAWIGLVPKQHSSGGKDKLGSISKQGDRYLRSLFTAGALAVIRYAKIHGTKHRPWLAALLARRPTKVVAIALANKTQEWRGP